MASDISDSDLSSDWTVVSSTSKDGSEELDAEVIEKNELCDSTLKDIEVLDKSDVAAQDQESCAHSEGSSSDVDVIEENNEEHVETTTLPSSDLSISTTAIVQESTDDKSEPVDTQGNFVMLHDRIEEQETVGFDPGYPSYFDHVIELLKGWRGRLMIVLIVALIFLSLMNSITQVQREELMQLREHFKNLEVKNTALRNMMLSEIENDQKIFSAFETHIKELRDENFKLKSLLEDVSTELHKQTVAQEKDFESKEAQVQAEYQNEINKLREQINILQFDNEELQKQLVRIRYGDFNPKVDDSDEITTDKPDTTDKKEDEEQPKGDHESTGKNENNLTDSVTEELRHLQQELHDEIDKLKKWNEMAKLLTEETQKASSNKAWSWQDFHQNIKDAILGAKTEIIDAFNNFPDINISGMFTKYMKYNKKQAKKIFNSLGHYIKVAQEKTKKILDPKSSEKEWKKVKNSIWNVYNNLEKRWSEADKGLFEDHEEPDHEEEKYTKENSKMHKSDKMEPQHDAHSYERENAYTDSHYYTEEDLHDDNRASEWHYKRQPQYNEATKHARSWMFERAAYRAKLRKREKDMPINWYLRRNKYRDDTEDTDQDFSQSSDDESVYPKRKTDTWRHF